MPGDPIYRQLQQDLDRMPVGCPATETGVELRILEQLFTPLEARIAICLNIVPEPVSVILSRLNGEMNRGSLASALESMAYRGLIRGGTRRGQPSYAKLPFVVGIYEGQVDRLTGQLARDLNEYFDLGLGQVIRPGTTPQLRTVPVNESVTMERGVAQYDDIRSAVRSSPGPFAVMNCICRQAQDLAGHPCRQTAVRENCLTMEGAAEVMVRHGQARYISRERMLELFDEADREGLVLQPQNTRRPLFVCVCCGCCCVALRASRKLDRPVDFFSANFHAEVNCGECQACGACVSRCQMEAVSIPDAAAEIDLARCIGCGLCTTTCPSGAMRLRHKAKPVSPPAGTDALYVKIYRERYGTVGLAKAALRLLVRRRA